LFVGVALAVACGTDSGADGDGPAETSSSSTTDTGSGTTTTESTTEAADTSTGAPPGDGILQCTEVCTVPLDCCVFGTAGCPGAYPYNVDCRDGVCVPPHCVEDDECTGAGEVCRPVRGVATCVTPCADDPEVCTPLGASLACVGTTDDGVSICFERCDEPGVFCGNPTCDPETGLCVCTSSGQCQVNHECLD